MVLETKTFDLSEALNSEQWIAAYLEEAFETGEPAVGLWLKMGDEV